jgi:hypothetical protein
MDLTCTQDYERKSLLFNGENYYEAKNCVVESTIITKSKDDIDENVIDFSNRTKTEIKTTTSNNISPNSIKSCDESDDETPINNCERELRVI